MIDFRPFYQQIATTNLSAWLETLPLQLKQWEKTTHGDYAKWAKIVDFTPNSTACINLKDKVESIPHTPLSVGETKQLTHHLKQLMPWRKGPYHLHGIHIDTEWRSDFKWDRVLPHLAPLKDRTILDVGCGSGYHMWRMVGEGAKMVVGIDPTELFLCQFEVVRNYLAMIAVRI
ncbi:tRNA mo(5)U34 methyltransferase [Actinobacillus equuli]|nr:tRNA mo(5)U34 methyltransferase [Actinobacillus equuli]